jgi:hypothetical protein
MTEPSEPKMEEATGQVRPEETAETQETGKTDVAADAEAARIKASPDILPRNTVHCFPARKSVIVRRRVLSVLFFLLLAAGAVYFMLPASASIGFFVLCLLGCAAAGTVFAHTFLIAGYRVALDYTEEQVVLRYMFQKIRIPFADFDTRAGAPDRAETMMTNLTSLSGKAPVKYLILDNVRESACYQTTDKDLDGEEDFLRLKAEAGDIRDVFRGKLPEPVKLDTEDEMDRIIQNAMSDQTKNIDGKGH